MVAASQVIGLKIYSLSQGEKVDRVADLFFDRSTFKVVGFLIDKGGWFTEEKIILFENISNIGADAIIIGSANLLKNASELGENIIFFSQGKKQLAKTVITESGKNLGRITDLYFDPDTGDILDFQISQGVSDLFSGRKLISVGEIIGEGKDVIITRSNPSVVSLSQEETRVRQKKSLIKTNRKIKRVNSEFAREYEDVKRAVYSEIRKRY